MKIDNSGKKFTYIAALIIALFGAISAAFVWQLTDREELINEPPSGRTVTTAPTQPETATPTPVMLRLPNADAVPALVDDYTNDASPWKLVNKSTPFGDLTYVPNVQLAPVATQAGRGIDERSLRADTFADLQAMFQDAAADGHELRVGSGHRSYATQAAIYNRYVAQVGEAQARTFSAPPGHSEHQSGLAVDLSSADQTCWLEIYFRDTPAGQWLAHNSYRYGFILRYPEGKEAVTGFQFEPWHFRYVGKDLATALYQSDLTLEEAQPYLREAQRMVAERKAS